MAIRFEHQPSGAAVGMAAYVAGRNRARQRRQDDLLRLLEKQHRFRNIYRTAMGGGRAQQLGQQQGEWVDPLDNPFEDKVTIVAQRRANDRARRLGKPVPHPEVEMQFRPAPTKEELEQQRWERGVQREEAVHERTRMERAEDVAERRTFDITKTRFEDLQEEFEAIGAGGAEAWDDTERMKEYYRVKRDLEMGQQDQKRAMHLTPTEYYTKGIKEMSGFLAGHKPTHLKPPEERPGYERVTKDGRLIRKNLDGTEEDLGPAPVSMLTPEQIAARDRERQSRIATVDGRRGQYRRDGYNEYFEPFKEVKEAQTPSWVEQVTEIGKKRTSATPSVGEALGYGADPKMWSESQTAEVNKVLGEEFPYPARIKDDRAMMVPGLSEPSSIAGGIEPAPQPSAGGGPTLISARGEPVGVEQQPLPAGMPAGSTWIDANTIRLPDGRTIRRKES